MHSLLKGTASRYAMYMSVWIHVYVSVSTFFLFLSFFLATVAFLIKNISHNTIHTFKNYLLQYFQFSIFTFQFSAKTSCIQMDTVVANAAWCFNLPFSSTSQILSSWKNFGTFPLNTKCLTFVGINGVCFMVRIGMK